MQRSLRRGIGRAVVVLYLVSAVIVFIPTEMFWVGRLLPRGPIAVYAAGWLSGWGYRVKFTIDNADITSALVDFPVLIYLSIASGRNDDDVSFVFDELHANRKKIAVTESDGTTECYVEIEKWDDVNEQAWLWVKVPSIASASDTDLYLYYDSTHADNVNYVGDTNSVPAENVWDANFAFVSHMRDDPDTSHIRDSTSNNNDGTKVAAGQPAVTTTGKIDDGQLFDGLDDKVTVAAAASLNPIGVTLEVWFKPTSGSLASQKSPIQKAYTSHNPPYYQYGLFMYDTVGSPKTLSFGVCINGVWTGGPDLANMGYDYTSFWYFVGSYNGATKKMYLNAVEKQSVVATGNMSGYNTVLALGDYPNLADTSAYQYGGVLDEVRVSKVGRSAAWITATYESGRDDLLDWGEETSANTDPTINAPGDVNYSEGSTGNVIAWIVTDPEQLTGNYTVYRNTTLHGASTWSNNTAINYNVDAQGVGLWNFTITATDGQGGLNATDTVFVNVTDVLPTINHPTDFNYTWGGSGVIHWIATDPGSSSGNYTVEMNGTDQGGPWTWANNTDMNYGVGGMPAGTWNFTIYVWDSYSASNVTDMVIVVVLPAVPIVHLYVNGTETDRYFALNFTMNLTGVVVPAVLNVTVEFSNGTIISGPSLGADTVFINTTLWGVGIYYVMAHGHAYGNYTDGYSVTLVVVISVPTFEYWHVVGWASGLVLHMSPLLIATFVAMFVCVMGHWRDSAVAFIIGAVMWSITGYTHYVCGAPYAQGIPFMMYIVSVLYMGFAGMSILERSHEPMAGF